METSECIEGEPNLISTCNQQKKNSGFLVFLEPVILGVPRPIKPYARDQEDPDDWANGWKWLEHDTGASFGPFLRTPQLRIDPVDNSPPAFFCELFDDFMWEQMTLETNIYASRRDTGMPCPTSICLFLLFFSFSVSTNMNQRRLQKSVVTRKYKVSFDMLNRFTQ